MSKSNKYQNLIEAAKKSGLIKQDDSDQDKDESYESFVLSDKKNQNKKYQICYSGNPDAAHPRAERAMRASDAIMDIFSVLEHSYNCFSADMTNFQAPTCDALKNVLRLEDAISFSEVAEMEVGESSKTITHMLEVVIDIYLGNEIAKTIVDRVFLEDNETGLRFKGANVDQSIRPLTAQAELSLSDDEKNSKMEEMQKKAKELLIKLGSLRGENDRAGDAVRIGDTYKQILIALSQEPDSAFSKYMLELAKKREETANTRNASDEVLGQNRGRVEMRFNALYIGAERAKKFKYTLAGASEDDPTFFLECGQSSVSDQVPLYFFEQDGVIVGMTTEVSKKTDYCFKDTDKIGIGLVPYPVAANQLRLKRILYPERLYLKRKCGYCGTDYFAADDLYQNYQRQFATLDNSCGCEHCAKDGEICNTNAKYFRYFKKAYYCVGTASQEGALFARVDSRGQLLPTDNNAANAFECANCGRIVALFRSQSTQSSIGGICYFCKKTICSACYKQENQAFCYGSGADSSKIVRKPFCKRCADETFDYNGRRHKIRTAVKVGDESCKVKVCDLYPDEEAVLLQVCYGCHKYLYVPDPSEAQRCARCGVFFGSTCSSSLISVADERVCTACEKDLKDLKANEEFTTIVRKDRKDEVALRCMQTIVEYLQSEPCKKALWNNYAKQFYAYMNWFEKKAFKNPTIDISQIGTPEPLDGKNSSSVRFRVSFCLTAKHGAIDHRYIVKAIVSTVLKDGIYNSQLERAVIKHGGV